MNAQAKVDKARKAMIKAEKEFRETIKECLPNGTQIRYKNCHGLPMDATITEGYRSDGMFRVLNHKTKRYQSIPLLNMEWEIISTPTLPKTGSHQLAEAGIKY